jgi:chorismate mutase/prephenate dehydratase
VFFIDIEGHANEAPVSDALAVLEKQSSLFRVLGAYPKAIG